MIHCMDKNILFLVKIRHYLIQTCKIEGKNKPGLITFLFWYAYEKNKYIRNQWKYNYKLYKHWAY